jgi:hypothetical protein
MRTEKAPRTGWANSIAALCSLSMSHDLDQRIARRFANQMAALPCDRLEQRLAPARFHPPNLELAFCPAPGIGDDAHLMSALCGTKDPESDNHFFRPLVIYRILR